MEKYLKIARVNLKYNLFPNIIITILFLLISPILMGVTNLDYIRTAQVLEMYVALIGIIILIPIFLPEQDKNIKDLIKSKSTYIYSIYLIRLLEAILTLVIFLFIFIEILRLNKCNFPMVKYYFGTLAEALCLGGLGIFIYSIFDNIAIAYMLPIIYYTLSIGGNKILKKMYLFSMARGSYDEKIYLGVVGIILIIVGILYKSIKN